ncbi:glycosyltransferase [Paenibacillus rhizophilus]|uniref:Glycosyltransferase n=1 Tax=Paenibacillus rhizophilus TaxID=1850366 RepID=A0A3N9PXA4_9BACL|nr:glycosyltransferase [Paenibacillus rhizophilus]RQW09826.1 glycosyltransferase [Paenibacillus rhizophilus]
MSIHSEAGVAQQMYTRQRRGVYRSTEGFDTVAKSESLDNNFVKKILHPFCLYDAPAELAAKGEKNESQYPPALHLFHLESGETVLGQSVFQAADFTGLRSAFFTHNYVLPALRAEEIVRDYGGYLHADFAKGFSGEPGEALPELSGIPASRRNRPRAADVLKSLGIDREMFKSLLQAIMQSMSGKKKIYISLNVPVSELSARAADLTEVLLGCLPFEFRRRLGVITYAKEPQSRKYIHLTFVETGSLRPGDRATEKDFIFDLAAGRTLGADFSASPQPFLELAWKLLLRGLETADDFAVFADMMLGGEPAERKLSLAAYNELAVFYRIEQGDEALYRENKSAVLNGLLSYLGGEGALESKIRLNDLFLERFDREFDAVRQKAIPEPAVLESFRDYFSLKGHNYRARIVDYFINGMLNAQNAGRGDSLEEAFGVVESGGELAAAFFRKLLTTPVFGRLLFQPYVESRLASAANAADLLEFVADWDRFMPEALRQPAVHDALLDYLPEKLERERDPVGAVAAIHDRIEQAEKDRRRRSGIRPEALALQKELAAAADRYLLERLSLDDITQEQLLELSFVRYSLEMGAWDPPLDLHSRRKANVLRTAYRWFGEEDPDEHIFYGLSPQEMDDVQLLGRRWLKENRGAEPFARLPLAFYHSPARDGGPLEYDALLEHLRRKADGDKEEVYRFLAWSQDNPLFAISSKKLQPGYRRAILKYFAGHDREAFKSRDFRKNHMAAAGPALQNVYGEARSQLASPLAQWVRRRRFQLMIFGAAVIVLLIAGVLAARLLKGGGDEAAPAASPQPSPSQPASGVSYLEAAAYLVHGDGKGGSSLLFAFASADACREFNPAEIQVDSGTGQAEIYKVDSLTHNCELPASASPSDAGDAAGAGEAADSGTVDGSGGTAGNVSGSQGQAEAASAGESEAAAESSAASAVPEASPGGDVNADSPSPSEEPAAGSSDSGSPAPASPGAGTSGLAPYQVKVTLVSSPELTAGSAVKAEDYTLVLMEDPQAAPSPSASTSPPAE